MNIRKTWERYCNNLETNLEAAHISGGVAYEIKKASQDVLGLEEQIHIPPWKGMWHSFEGKEIRIS